MPDTILYAASTFGHIASFHVPYVRELARRGHRVLVVAGGEPLQGLPAGVECVSLPFTKSMTSPRNLGVARAVARIVRQEGVGCVLTHTSLAAFFVRLGVQMSGCRPRVVNTVHGYLFDAQTPAPKRQILLGAEKLTAGVTDAIVTMNRQDTALARTHRLARGAVTEVPGMGVDPSRFHLATPQERASARERLGIPPTAFLMLYAAEFSARKNQGMLIEAMRNLPVDVTLALPGRGELLEQCRQRVREQELGGRVVLPGQVADLGVWRSAADVCVSSSRSEGLPFHALEAMRCGLPLVLSDVKGHEDLVGAGETGLLYPYGDVADFTHCVERLHGDAELRASMGRAAAEHSAHYALPVVMPQVLEAWGL